MSRFYTGYIEIDFNSKTSTEILDYTKISYILKILKEKWPRGGTQFDHHIDIFV